MTLKRKGLLICLCLWLMIGACAVAEAPADVSALFINVGKADAALIFLGEDCYLVDSGTKDSHEQLVRVLDAYGVKHFDGIFITHTDKDHAGGLKKLLKSGVTTDMLYASALHSEKSLDDHRVYEAAEKYQAPLTWLRAGDTIAASDGSVFHVLGPLSQDPFKENNNSLVLRLETSEGAFLLTGDMEHPEEEELLAAGLIMPAEVLKVGNHGENDATSQAFALAVSPQWSVISTNTQEEPDTPDRKVLSCLTQVKSSIAITQDAEVGILVTLQDGKASAHKIDWQ